MGRWMQMNIEDAQDALHCLMRAVQEHDRKWSRHFLQQAYYYFFCMLYGHGCRKEKEVFRFNYEEEIRDFI